MGAAVIDGCRLMFFARASLRLVPASQRRASTPTRENRACRGPRAYWEQLRASLRREEGHYSSALRPDSAAIASLRPPSRRKPRVLGTPGLWGPRSSRALTLVLRIVRPDATFSQKHPKSQLLRTRWGIRHFNLLTNNVQQSEVHSIQVPSVRNGFN